MIRPTCKLPTSIQSAIDKDKNKWIRPDGDIWYKISPEHEFVGRDYVHLTLEDLINSYEYVVCYRSDKCCLFLKK